MRNLQVTVTLSKLRVNFEPYKHWV